MKLNKILKTLIFILSMVIVVCLIILFVQTLIEPNEKDEFTENVVISGINVKGLTKNQAENEIEKSLNSKLNDLKITLTYKDKKWEYSSKDFNVNTKVHVIVDDAYRYTKLSSDKQQALNILSTQGYNFDVAFDYIFPDFQQKLELIKAEIEKEPVNSEVTFLPNEEEKFKISKSENGIKINEDKLYSVIENQFKTQNEINVEIETIEISPEINEEWFSDKLELLGEFTTDLSTSKGGRKHNVTLALSKINGKVVESNEEVSFNALTGPQTVEEGYESAIIIMNGQFVEGVGGGICQASTTLYNALLLSGVDIQEVHKHTLPVGYVELSLDAMVNEGTADLRFKNVSDYPIYINAYVEGNTAYARIYGQPLEKGVTYKRSVEYVRTIPHKGDKIIKDEKGEYSDKVNYVGEYYRLSYPKEGYEAKGYLEKYKDGELISKIMVRHEIYEPKMGVLIEGVKQKTKDEETNSKVDVIPPQIEVETLSENFIQNLSQFEL